MTARNDPKMTAEQLTRYRKKTRRTQEEFARDFSLSVGGLQKYEQGQRPVPDLLANAIRLEKRARSLEDLDA